MTIAQIEQQLLQDAANRYRQRGYVVEEGAALGADLEVDLVASKGDELRAVQVQRSGRTLKPDWQETMTKWLRGHPHRHLDLVTGTPNQILTVEERDAIEQKLKTVAAIEVPEASLLLLWSVFEAAARWRVFRDRGRLTAGADPLSSVGTWGLLDPSEVDALRPVQHLRNQLAHGQFLTVPSESLELLRGATETLLADDPQ